MDEHLELYAGVPLPQCADAIQGKLPGEDDPLDAQLLCHAQSRVVVHCHLRRCMDGEAGELLPQQVMRAQVLDNNAVHGKRCQPGECLEKPVELSLPHNRVDRHVHLFPFVRRELTDPPQLIQ